jgi:hypothetical protein
VKGYADLYICMGGVNNIYSVTRTAVGVRVWLLRLQRARESEGIKGRREREGGSMRFMHHIVKIESSYNDEWQDRSGMDLG